MDKNVAQYFGGTKTILENVLKSHHQENENHIKAQTHT